MSTPKRAIILLSGGLDSATMLAMAQRDRFACYAMSFAYGQRQHIELAAARRVVQRFVCIEHRIIHIDLAAFGGSALTADIDVPKGPEAMEETVPVTYVPARNTIFLSYALAWAEVLGAYDIFIGANRVDYAGYPDCRPEFIAAFTHLANHATCATLHGERRFLVHAPLMHLSKSEIIQQGLTLGVNYGETHSCYDPLGDLACGRCNSCLLRRNGFLQAGVPDPTRYGIDGVSRGGESGGLRG